MIAVDTSALMAILQAEPHERLCAEALSTVFRPKISAVTVAEAAHPAALDFEDCFAYDVAATHDCPLLYVGPDFAKADIPGAIDA